MTDILSTTTALIQRAVSSLTPRDYAEPGRRSTDGQVLDIVTDVTQQVFQALIDAEPSGPSRIRRLHTIQRENHFLSPERLASIERRRITDEDRRFFLVQTNQARASRSQPDGRRAPVGIALRGQRDLVCPIDPANMVWQSAGLQFVYRTVVGGRAVVLAVNPWPLTGNHTSVVWADDAPQDWRTPEQLRELLEVMIELATTHAGFFVFFNGLAGASIPNRRHLHLCEQEPIERPFPCQVAAAQAIAAKGASHLLRIDPRFYPMPLFRFAGPSLVNTAIRFIVAWHEDIDDATENLLAFTEADEVVIYVALRQRGLVKAPGLSGHVAGLEVAGEFVMAAESEIRAVKEHNISYAQMAAVLRDVTPWRAFGLSARED